MTQPASSEPPAAPDGQSIRRLLLPLGVILAAVALFVVLLGTVFKGALGVDANVPADGMPYAVQVPTDRDRILLATANSATQCQVTDLETGAQIALEDLPGGHVSRGREDWRFDPGSGRLEIVCSAGSPGTQMRVVPAFERGSVTILFAVPGLVAAVGLALLVARTTSLVRSRRTR